jgi:hypothetical protein
VTSAAVAAPNKGQAARQQVHGHRFPGCDLAEHRESVDEERGADIERYDPQHQEVTSGESG